MTIACLTCTYAHSQEQSGLTGSWQLNDAMSDNIDIAIDRSVDSMNFFTKKIAKRRLSQTNTPHQKITISSDETSIQISYGDTIVKAPRDGTFIQWQRNDGAIYSVSHKYDNNNLVAIFKNSEGEKLIVFDTTRQPNQLFQRVVVTSDKLPKQLEYQLVYERQAYMP